MGHDERTLQTSPGEAVRAKTEAEIYLKQSSLNWTILRPCGLDNSEDSRHILTDHPDGIPKTT